MADGVAETVGEQVSHPRFIRLINVCLVLRSFVCSVCSRRASAFPEWMQKTTVFFLSFYLLRLFLSSCSSSPPSTSFSFSSSSTSSPSSSFPLLFGFIWSFRNPNHTLVAAPRFHFITNLSPQKNNNSQSPIHSHHGPQFTVRNSRSAIHSPQFTVPNSHFPINPWTNNIIARGSQSVTKPAPPIRQRESFFGNNAPSFHFTYNQRDEYDFQSHDLCAKCDEVDFRLSVRIYQILLVPWPRGVGHSNRLGFPYGVLILSLNGKSLISTDIKIWQLNLGKTSAMTLN